MNVKGSLIYFISAMVLIVSCDKNLINHNNGELISLSSCKYDKFTLAENDETCIEYNYNAEDKILNLKHINTAFNCCPDKLYCDISIKNDTVIIEESERKQGCLCLCLYDIESEVYNIEAKSYILKFIEPYLGDQEELVFEIDLSFNISGTHCVERVNYPWGL